MYIYICVLFAGGWNFAFVVHTDIARQSCNVFWSSFGIHRVTLLDYIVHIYIFCGKCMYFRKADFWLEPFRNICMRNDQFKYILYTEEIKKISSNESWLMQWVYKYMYDDFLTDPIPICFYRTQLRQIIVKIIPVKKKQADFSLNSILFCSTIVYNRNFSSLCHT